MYEKTIGKKRSRFQIIADILKKLRKPSKKTHIMQKCNLSFPQLKHYLSYLSFTALIRRKEKKGMVKYHITKKGWDFLKNYNRITKLLQP